MKKDELMEKLQANLPVIWERTLTTKLTGGVVRSNTLTNLMSQGDKPEGTFRAGKSALKERVFSDGCRTGLKSYKLRSGEHIIIKVCLTGFSMQGTIFKILLCN